MPPSTQTPPPVQQPTQPPVQPLPVPQMEPPIRIDRQWKVLLMTLLVGGFLFGVSYVMMVANAPPKLQQPSKLVHKQLGRRYGGSLSLYSSTKDVRCLAVTSTGSSRSLHGSNGNTELYDGVTYYFIGQLSSHEHYVRCSSDEPLLTMHYGKSDRTVGYVITAIGTLGIFAIGQASYFIYRRMDRANTPR